MHHLRFNDEIRNAYEDALETRKKISRTAYEEVTNLRKRIDDYWDRHGLRKSCTECERYNELEILPNEFLHCVDGVHQLYKKCPNCDYTPLYVDYISEKIQ